MTTTTCHDEARVLRLRLREMEDEAHRRSGGGGCGQAWTYLLRTVSLGSYPAEAARFFACESVVADGVEAVGEPVTLAAGRGPIFALNVGTTIPPVGTVVAASAVDGYYTFQYDGPEI
jgi:hypothetical protein